MYWPMTRASLALTGGRGLARRVGERRADAGDLVEGLHGLGRVALAHESGRDVGLARAEATALGHRQVLVGAAEDRVERFHVDALLGAVDRRPRLLKDGLGVVARVLEGGADVRAAALGGERRQQRAGRVLPRLGGGVGLHGGLRQPLVPLSERDIGERAGRFGRLERCHRAIDGRRVVGAALRVHAGVAAALLRILKRGDAGVLSAISQALLEAGNRVADPRAIHDLVDQRVRIDDLARLRLEARVADNRIRSLLPDNVVDVAAVVRERAEQIGDRFQHSRAEPGRAGARHGAAEIGVLASGGVRVDDLVGDGRARAGACR